MSGTSNGEDNDESVRIRLVVEGFQESDLRKSPRCSSDMMTAKRLCDQYKYNGLISEWVTEKECLEMKNLSKRDVFVLDNFSGNVFDKLSTTKAVILGPKCLSCCLTEGSEIPRGPNPVFTIAMRNLVVTVTGLSSEEKAQIKKKVLWMGGCCENILTNMTTHIVSNDVLSEKHIKAASLGLPAMNSNWVEAVWKSSLEKNVSAIDSQFDDYKLPIFFGVTMTYSGLDKRERNTLKNLLQNNGSIFLKDFVSDSVNVLLLGDNAIGGNKHKAAIEFKKICVSPLWIYRSIEKGHILHYKDFAVGTHLDTIGKTSSPNRASQLPNFSLNISAIKGGAMNYVNETYQTLESTQSTMSTPFKSNTQGSQRGKRLCGVAKEFAQLIDNIDIKCVKQAGLFLDGCCIYVYGLTVTRRDKLYRIISRAGGVRYDEPVEAVTHIVCGDPSVNLTEVEKSSMPRALHVTVRWLTDSLEAHKCLGETPYFVCNNEKKNNDNKMDISKASPMSKRNLQLLQSPACRPPVPIFRLEKTVEENDDIVQLYKDHKMNDDGDELLANNTEHQITIGKNEKDQSKTIIKADNLSVKSDTNYQNKTKNKSDEVEMDESDDETCQDVLVFSGLTFELQDMEEESEQVITCIENAGGIVVEPGKGDKNHYIVVPINCAEVINDNEYAEVITSTWLEDCLMKETIVPIDYFHKPVKLPDNKPLEGLVFAVSTYADCERLFITEIAALLGATVQSSLHRRDAENLKRSTHLICSDASGNKYKGAVTWGLPVVTSKWLMDCLAAGKRIREGPYLLGDSVEPEWEDDVIYQKCDNITLKYANTNVKENVISTEKTNTDINQHQTPSKDCYNIEPVVENKENKQCLTNSTKRKSQRLSLGGSSEMSPVSRYIAMARQGLLGCDSQETPKKQIENERQNINSNDSMSTPSMENALSTPNVALFSSTSKRRINAIKRGERMSNPISTPSNPFDVSCATPDSPFGEMLGGKMSPKSRKRLYKFCDELPSGTSSNANTETPISELKNKFFKCLDRRKNSPTFARKLIDVDNESETPPMKQRKLSDVENKPSSSQKRPTSEETGTEKDNNDKLENELRMLHSLLTKENGNSSSPLNATKNKRSISQKIIFDDYNLIANAEAAGQDGCIESQMNTVCWDMTALPAPEQPKFYKFILSTNLNNYSELKQIIERLGGIVSEENELDTSATHLICKTLGRSEKLIGCIAACKWILNPSYILRCQEAGRFVDEELYEWGNPKAKTPQLNDSEKQLANAAYRWRSKSAIKPLPFSSFKVILYIQEARKKAIARVLKAGGGQIVDVEPPFTGEIDATHCLMEQNRLTLSIDDIKYLANRKIPVCQPLYLNAFLVNEQPPDVMNFAYSEYKNYVKK